jgi:hypothetical protein
VLPYLGPTDELRESFAKAHKTLCEEVKGILMSNLEAEGEFFCYSLGKGALRMLPPDGVSFSLETCSGAFMLDCVLMPCHASFVGSWFGVERFCSLGYCGALE